MHRHQRQWWGALAAGLLAACAPSMGPDVDSFHCDTGGKPPERVSLSRVKDINQEKLPLPEYDRRMSAVGNTAFFASPGAEGVELWKSDRTEAGTVQVRDVRLGSASSSPASLVELNGALYFLAVRKPESGYHYSGYYFGYELRNELWKSDGTQAGTCCRARLLMEIWTDWLMGISRVSGRGAGSLMEPSSGVRVGRTRPRMEPSSGVRVGRTRPRMASSRGESSPGGERRVAAGVR